MRQIEISEALWAELTVLLLASAAFYGLTLAMTLWRLHGHRYVTVAEAKPLVDHLWGDAAYRCVMLIALTVVGGYLAARSVLA